MKTIKTLAFHKLAIKKACAALVKDGYSRNQAIGALIEFFLSDGNNSVFFNNLMTSYMELLNESTLPFQPHFFNTKKMLREVRNHRLDKPLRSPGGPRSRVRPPFRQVSVSELRKRPFNINSFYGKIGNPKPRGKK